MLELSKTHVSLEQVWLEVEPGMAHLLSSMTEGFGIQQHMKLYSLIFNYCSQPVAWSERTTAGAIFRGEDLYASALEFLQAHAKQLFLAAEKKVGESLLNFYQREWERYSTAMRVIDKLFHYLNSNWIRRAARSGKQVYDIYTLATLMWRENLFHPLKAKLNAALHEMVHKERNKEDVDFALIRATIGAYGGIAIKTRFHDTVYKPFSLEVFKQDFFMEFAIQTQQFFSSHTIRGAIPEYMRTVHASIEAEMNRFQLVPSKVRKILRVVLDITCIENHKKTIQDEFLPLLQKDKYEDLKLMYNLMTRIDQGTDDLSHRFGEYVLSEADAQIKKTINIAKTNPVAYLHTLTEVPNKFSVLVKRLFKNDKKFSQKIESSMFKIVNNNELTQHFKQPSASAETLARCSHAIITSHADKNLFNQMIEELLTVYRYLNDTESFQLFYQQLLAKRLLAKPPSSMEMETYMLSKFAPFFGFECILKCRKMFNDVSASALISPQFRASKLHHLHLVSKVDFEVLVLSNGPWPVTPPNQALQLPPDMAACVKSFNFFFRNTYRGRTLSWLHQFGECHFTGHYLLSKKPLALRGSPQHVALLSLFEEQEVLTNQMVRERANIDQPVLLNILRSLVLDGILLMQGNLSGPQTKFKLNTKFIKNDCDVIDLGVRSGENSARAPRGLNSMEETKKLKLRAILLRILKAQKQSNIDSLCKEAESLLGVDFKPDPTQVKLQLEFLSSRGYITSNEGLYSYVP